MERISGDEIDLFLLQAEEKYCIQEKRVSDERLQERHSLPGFTAWLPEDFVRMGREEAAAIFWSTDRPEMAFVSRERGAGITFRILDETDGDLMGRIRDSLARIDGRTVFYGSGREETETEVHWLEYKSFSADGRVYNLLFSARYGGKEILGQYFCPFEEYDRLKPLAWKIMRSIKCDGLAHACPSP